MPSHFCSGCKKCGVWCIICYPHMPWCLAHDILEKYEPQAEDNTTSPTWTLKLNKYQRDNLLWLLNAVGYPSPNALPVEPFNCANTGDWVGEIASQLKPGGLPVLDVDDRPNISIEALRELVEAWKTNK